MRMPDFIKLALSFKGKYSDPVVAEDWIREVEKAFLVCQTLEDLELSLAEFQLKELANN